MVKLGPNICQAFAVLSVPFDLINNVISLKDAEDAVCFL
jgi:hypothetical protein